ncbi:uncharacterized protein LOC131505692 [Neofelis nebulosa]|uniref:uncharacterized protein LOC131505692 n=1 Tax=Neofelis nebulosa TaxID=61452 RepID=UPI00272D8F99|nr:uncharacterized protein LOC131505692 [Neofelis nebulosa]
MVVETRPPCDFSQWMVRPPPWEMGTTGLGFVSRVTKHQGNSLSRDHSLRARHPHLTFNLDLGSRPNSPPHSHVGRLAAAFKAGPETAASADPPSRSSALASGLGEQPESGGEPLTLLGDVVLVLPLPLPRGRCRLSRDRDSQRPAGPEATPLPASVPTQVPARILAQSGKWPCGRSRPECRPFGSPGTKRGREAGAGAPQLEPRVRVWTRRPRASRPAGQSLRGPPPGVADRRGSREAGGIERAAKATSDGGREGGGRSRLWNGSRARLGAPSTPPEVPEGTVLGVQEHKGNPRRKWRALAARMDPHRPLRQGSNHRWIQGLTTPLLLFVGCDGQGRSLAREGSGPQQRAVRASIFSPGHFSVSPCTTVPGSWPPSAILPSVVCASNKRNLERARDFLSSTSVSLCWTEWKENEAKGGWGGGRAGPTRFGERTTDLPLPGAKFSFLPLVSSKA